MRRIRSYVRRESRFTESQKRALLTLWPKYGLELGEHPLNLTELFERVAPTVLEIGFGDGEALLQMAIAHPDQNYIGIEVYRPGVSQLLSKMEQQQLTNIRVFNQDATEVIEKAFEDNSLDVILIFFADPWPKTRHQKRRIIQENFVKQVSQKLKVGGILHLATDWENYAQHMMNTLTNIRTFKNRAGEGNYSERPETRPLTKYERRGNSKGHLTWDLIFERVDYTKSE